MFGQRSVKTAAGEIELNIEEMSAAFYFFKRLPDNRVHYLLSGEIESTEANVIELASRLASALGKEGVAYRLEIRDRNPSTTFNEMLLTNMDV